MAYNEEERLGRIIDLCLYQVESGQETFDSVVSRYPDLADTLRPQLKAALWLAAARQTLNPQPAFIEASQRRLINRIQQDAVAQKRSRPAAPLSFWERWFPARRPAFQFAMALLLMILLVFSGETVALAARGAIPGDTLYSVKLAQEKAQLALTLTRLGDARLQTRFANRRLMEIEGLIVQGRFERIPAAVADYDEQVALALSSLEQIIKQDPAQGFALAAELQEALAERTQDVTVLAANLPPSSRSQVDQVLVVSKQSLETVEALVSENGGQLPTIQISPTVPTLVFSPEPGASPSISPATTTPLAPLTRITPTSPPTATTPPTAAATLLPTATSTLNKTQIAATLTTTVSPTPRPAFRSPPPTNTPTPENRRPVKPTKEPRPTKEPKEPKPPPNPPNPPGRTPKPD